MLSVGRVLQRAPDQDSVNCCSLPQAKSPFIRVTIGKNVVSALWDSGSDLRLIAADKIKDEAELTPVDQGEIPRAVEGSKVFFKANCF